MSHPCNTSFKGYLNYECYKDLNYQFGDKLKDRGYMSSTFISDIGKEYENGKLKIYNDLSEIFTKLKAYLSNDHVFGWGKYNDEGTCTYMSYLLCGQIRDKLYGTCDKGRFDILKEFVDKYNNSTSSYACRNYFKHLGDNEFRKMNALYDFYDKYIKLSAENLHGNTKYCSDMLNLVYLYNNSLFKQFLHDSSEFNDVLKHIYALMENITETGRICCTNEKFPIRNPGLFISSVVQEQPPTHTSSERDREPSHEGILDDPRNPIHSEGTSALRMSLGEEIIADPVNSRVSEVSQSSVEAINFVSEEPFDRNQLPQNLEHLGKYESFGQPPYVSRGSHGSESYYGKGGRVETKNRLSPENPRVVTKPLGTGINNSGFMTNVQNGISEFIKDVDPVPVMGVSGGMGALYLLLR
ncbi:CYIR protein, partial [Plasmodium cynomolgi strain B]